MSLLARCSDKCCICGCNYLCFSGNSDDDFYPATNEQLIERLKKDQVSYNREMIIDELRKRGVCL